jgi:hypothetical protein
MTWNLPLPEIEKIKHKLWVFDPLSRAALGPRLEFAASTLQGWKNSCTANGGGIG